jgi:hypothetical protein
MRHVGELFKIVMDVTGVKTFFEWGAFVFFVGVEWSGRAG